MDIVAYVGVDVVDAGDDLSISEVEYPLFVGGVTMQDIPGCISTIGDLEVVAATVGGQREGSDRSSSAQGRRSG